MSEKKKNIKLKEKVLEKVSGGYCYWMTNMKCEACGYSVDWDGDFLEAVYNCPNCNAEGKFKGIERWR